MPDQYVGVMQGDSRRRRSDAVWKGCPWLEIFTGDVGGVQWFDDFTTASAALTNAALSNYLLTGNTGTGVLVATDDGGVLSLRSSASAAKEAYLAGGQALGAFQQFLSSTPNEMWFESRVRFNDIATGGFYIGLAKPTDIATGFLVNTTLVVASTVNHVGFNVNAATPTKIDIVYGKGAAPTTYKAGAATLTSTSQWWKLGMRFSSQNGKNLIRFFINGTEIANTAGTLGVASTATNFPSSVAMTSFHGSKSGAGAEAKNLDVDWLRYAGIIEDTTYGVSP